MSTIASPRPSISLSSRRTSTSTDTTTLSNSTTRPTPSSSTPAGSVRRTRTALRDYYNLQAEATSASSNPTSTSTPPTPTLDLEQESELDDPSFNPATYISLLLSRESLESVLRIEAALVNEIRSLDGEKKALVYDNYSKLIAATDTIKRMREKMDPMTPMTATLGPAMAHIAEMAVVLSGELREKQGVVKSGRSVSVGEKERQKQQETVRWVLSSPTRLRVSVDEGRKDEAEAEWKEVSTLLDKWQGVSGVEGVRQACLQALAHDTG